MFGVGFYSVFSLTEEPVVYSGNEAMKFKWDGPTLTCSKSSNSSRSALTQTHMVLKPDRQMNLDGSDWKNFLADLKSFMLRLVLFLKNVDEIRLEIAGRELFFVKKDIRLRSIGLQLPRVSSQSGLFCASEKATNAAYYDLVVSSDSKDAISGQCIPRRAQYQLLETDAAIQVGHSCVVCGDT